jgi:threonine aldolase
MTVHMDGARFANAVAGAGSTPAELTWRAGVDAMSFGATKGGALAAEAVVVFSERTRDDIERLRKRTGHLLSKQRFAAAQFVAWLADDTWLRLADHANQLAVRLADGLTRAGIRISHPVEANITHAWFGPATMAAAGAVGAEFYQDSPVTASDGTLEVRLVTSWSTTPEDVDTLVAAVSSVADRQSD